MLVSIADFIGEYRLHNVNNPDPDLVTAIDQAQTALTYETFSKGAGLILPNPPAAPPNAGLRALHGFIDLFCAYAFSHIQLAVLGAGARKNNEHPGQNTYATRNYYMIAHYFRYSYNNFLKYQTLQSATATAIDTLTLPTPDPILPLLLAPGYTVNVPDLGLLTLSAITATTLTFTTSPFVVGNNYLWVQDELKMRSSFNYL